MDRFPLYTHQEEALSGQLWRGSPNLLVATGTGSGKTEAFVLPILARILNEARAWSAPKSCHRVMGSSTQMMRLGTTLAVMRRGKQGYCAPSSCIR